jgi:hypothetical protein
MNKFKFLVEIETPENISKAVFDCCVRRGLMQYYEKLPTTRYEVSKIENNVEQNVERSKNQEKMIDLLRRASERLHDYAIDFTSGNSDSLATQIDEFLSGKQ